MVVTSILEFSRTPSVTTASLPGDIFKRKTTAYADGGYVLAFVTSGPVHHELQFEVR